MKVAYKIAQAPRILLLILITLLSFFIFYSAYILLANIGFPQVSFPELQPGLETILLRIISLICMAACIVMGWSLYKYSKQAQHAIPLKAFEQYQKEWGERSLEVENLQDRMRSINHNLEKKLLHKTQMLRNAYSELSELRKNTEEEKAQIVEDFTASLETLNQMSLIARETPGYPSTKMMFAKVEEVMDEMEEIIQRYANPDEK